MGNAEFVDEQAEAQEPKPAGDASVSLIDPEEVVDALMVVTDPEIGVDVVNLGLVYGIDIEGSHVHLRMTLTSMGCPATALMEHMAKEAVGTVDGVGSVSLEWTFDPPWSPEKMSDEGREMLQAMGFW